MGHEIAHVLEGTELYDVLSEAVKNYAISKEGLDGFNARLKAVEDLYKGVKGANPDGEVVADLVGEYIFSDTDFVGRLSTGNRDLFDRIFDEIKYLCRVVTAGSKEARQLEKVKKAFEEAYRTEIKNPTGDGGVKYSLTEYSEQQKKNWSTSKRIVIYDNPQQLSQFIQDSVTNKTMDKKMYFGAIPSDLATRIESDAGVNVENYNLSLGSYEIRKILKDHGNEATESPRGQRAIVEDDFAHIVDIVLNPKNIALSDDTYMGKPAIIFTGEHNGRMNVVAVVSDKRLDLFVQTVFVNVKKGNLSTPIGEQAPINTPEANNGTVSNIKITQSGNGVKSQLSLSDSNSMPNSGSQYSLSEQSAQANVTANYHNTVDQVLNMQNTRQDHVIIGYTPDVYRSLGMPSLPFVIGTGHIYSAAKTEVEAKQDGNYRKGVHYHGLGAGIVKNIYEKLKDPVMIISSKDVSKNATPMRSTHSVVAIVDVGNAQKSLLLPVEITAERTVDGVRMDVNALSSIYDRNVENLVKEAIALENTGDVGIYYAKKEALTLPGAGVRFPVLLQQSMTSNSIIHRFSEKVNMNIQDATQSQQFKRWFGDWQNHPENASKVVNADGTPKVVYHGSYKNFSVFDGTATKHSNAPTGSHFFTDDIDVGYSYTGYKETAKPGGHAYQGGVYHAYLNIKNPYTVDFEGRHWSEKVNGMDVNETVQYAKKNGYDGVIIHNVIDEGGMGDKDWNENVPRKPATDYVVFDSTQIKSATDNIGTFDGSNPDIRYSLSDINSMPRGKGTLGRDIMYAPAAGESSAVPIADNAASNAENVLPNATVAEKATAESAYEGIPIRSDIPQRATEDIGPVRSGLTAPAEKASAPMRDIGPVRADIGQTAGQGSGGTRMKERSWAQTATGSEAVGGAIRKEELDPDKLYYQPISNRKTLDNANALLDRQGYEAAVPYFNMKLADRNVSLDDVALGERLIQEALKRGDKETAAELIQNVSILGTELGQKVQALSIIKRLTPEGQLMMLQKTVERGKVVADLVGEYIFSDADFVSRLSTGNRDLFDRIFDEIKYLCRVVTAGSKEARKLEKVKKAFEEAYRTEIKNPTGDGGVEYSVNSNDYDYTKPFAQQLSDFRNGVFPERDTFVLGGTPTVLKNIGMASLPLTINQKHVGDALNGTYKGTQQEKLDHTFTAQELSTLPEKIADPIAIIYDKRTGKANASESNIDVLVEMTVASGKQVIFQNGKRCKKRISRIAL